MTPTLAMILLAFAGLIALAVNTTYHIKHLEALAREQKEKEDAKCAHCGEPMYALVRAHHHTEIIDGREQDVTGH